MPEPTPTATGRSPLPIVLIVDDPAPLINLYWWHVAEPAGTDRPTLPGGEPVARDIPVDFLDEFVEVVERWGVRGKFSVVPYPAALGPIDAGWPGCDAAGLERWLDGVRRHVAPRMDITPEILTHARALDLPDLSPLSEDERHWARHQTAATLTPYIARALEILGRLGLGATGVTSPWDCDNAGTAPRSHVAWRDGDRWLVSVWAQVDDYLWGTMASPAQGPAAVGAVADRYLTPDGRGGRLAELFAAGCPLVLCTHWQSLFANGRRTGLRALDEVCRRVDACFGDAVRWSTCSDLAAAVAAAG